MGDEAADEASDGAEGDAEADDGTEGDAEVLGFKTVRG